MIDEQKVLGLLQAKALGCLDPSDENMLSGFIDGGHLFPWDELGVLQSVASLFPISLPLELPDPSLKDKIALRLIKLTEEIRAQKIIEEEKQRQSEVETTLPQEQEFTEEVFEEKIEEYEDSEEKLTEQQSETEEITGIITEIPDIAEENNFNMDVEEATFNLDNVVLPDYESINTPETEFDQIAQPGIETFTEKPIEEPSVEKLPIDTVAPFEELSTESSFTDSAESFEEPLTETPQFDKTETLEELPTETSFTDSAESFEEPLTETPQFDSAETLEDLSTETSFTDSAESFEEPLTETPQFDTAKQSEEPIIESMPAETYTETTESLISDHVLVEQTETIKEDVSEQIQSNVVQEVKAASEPDSEKYPDLTKRSVADKMFKAIEQDFDSLKQHYEKSEAKLKRGLLVSYIVIAILFLLLVFSFFKLSSDVNGLLDKIKSMKKNSTSSLIEKKNINSFYQFFC
ncbi:MAG: hypothetical protein RBR74_01255 [Ignavibacteriaceae bacterium]|jgi:hypothetical protein|nr:hypothetical protein [Ignavibacteriaceae bacterium]